LLKSFFILATSPKTYYKIFNFHFYFIFLTFKKKLLWLMAPFYVQKMVDTQNKKKQKLHHEYSFLNFKIIISNLVSRLSMLA